MSYIYLLENLNKNYKFHLNLKANGYYTLFNYIKLLKIENYVESFMCLVDKDYKIQQNLYNKYLFNLIDNNNNSSYMLLNNNMIKNTIVNSKYKNLYTNMMLNELNISKNLIINANYNEAAYKTTFENFFKTSTPIFKLVDNSLDRCIFKIKYDNIYLTDFSIKVNRYNKLLKKIVFYNINSYSVDSNVIDLKEISYNLNFKSFFNKI